VQSGDHPENNLVRFGYTLLTRDESRKKLKKKILLLFLATYWNLS
jgi:hypothetical protein